MSGLKRYKSLLIMIVLLLVFLILTVFQVDQDRPRKQ